jgi:protein involved in polysaccharide export with SLBB domain
MKVLLERGIIIFLIMFCFVFSTFSQTPEKIGIGGIGGSNIHPFVAGDALRIFLPLDSASFLNGVYPIDDNGIITLPIVGDFSISGLTMQQFKEYITKTYEIYLRFPEVQISPLIRVSLLGGFVKAGMYYIEPQRSIWDLVSIAGGTKDEKGLSKMRWERDRKTIKKDLIPLIESGRSLKSMGFKSGDQLWTPGESKRFTDFVIRDFLPIGSFLISVILGINAINHN